MTRRPLAALTLLVLAPFAATRAQETASDTLLTVNHYLDWEQVAEPQLSPDGSQIAFVSTTCTPSCVNDLYVVSAAGTGLRRLTTDAGVQRPAWRPQAPLTPPPTAAPAPASQARRGSAP